MALPRLVAAGAAAQAPTLSAPTLTVAVPGAVRGDLVFIYSTALDSFGETTQAPIPPAGFTAVETEITAFGSGALWVGRVVDDDQTSFILSKAPGQGRSIWAAKAWVVRNAVREGSAIDVSSQVAGLGADMFVTPALVTTGNDRLVIHFVAIRAPGLGSVHETAPYVNEFSERRAFTGARIQGFDALALDVDEAASVDASGFGFTTGDPTESSWDIVSVAIIGRTAVSFPAAPDPRDLSLDCADSYTAWITDQDLETRIDSVPWSNIRWERVLDDQSQASITAPDSLGGAYCLAALGGLEPWRFGLLLERNDVEVWKGPIVGVGRPQDEAGRSVPYVEIRAADAFAWYVKRPTTWTGPIEYDETDAGYIFKQAITVLSRVAADRWSLDCPDVSVGEPLKRTLRWEDQESAWSVISELMGAAVDAFIMKGVLYVWSPDGGWLSWERGRNIQLEGPYNQSMDLVYGTFTEQSFVGRPSWDIDGMNQANYFVVPTADTGTMGFRDIFVAQDGPSQARYGVLWARDPNPLHRASDDAPAVSDGVFQARADTSVALRRMAPAVMTGGVLAQGAPVDIENIRPGSIWMADVYDAGFGQLLTAGRLKRIDVDVNVTENGIIETISPTLYPIGHEGDAA